jgi:hypothetical protein
MLSFYETANGYRRGDGRVLPAQRGSRVDPMIALRHD